MLRPSILFSRRAALVVLIGLFALLSSISAAAQPAVEPPAAAPAQAAFRLYLPILRSVGTPAPAGAPVIESFQLSSAAGPMAAEVELRWQVRGATSLRIDPIVGDVRGAASASVYPVATTTYTLTATNDKGSVTATATYTVNGLPAPNPIMVAARPDAGRAATASIGAAGGTVTATGADGTRYTLTVPPDALVHTEAITLTPAADIDGMPFAATGVRAVSIGPEGLQFIEPATLTITPLTAPPEGSRQVGLAYEGAGAEFYLRGVDAAGAELQQAGGGVSQSVVAARSYGTATPNAGANLSALASRAPSNPGNAAEHAYNTGIEDEFNASIRRVMLLQNLRDDYAFFTRVWLLSSPEIYSIDVAVREYTNWRARARAGELEEQLQTEIRDANQLLNGALQRAGEQATERCNQDRPAQGFALQRYMGYAKRFGLTNTRAALEDSLQRCWSFRLTFDSRMGEGDDEGELYEYKLQAIVDLVYEPEQGRIVGTGEIGYLRFAWVGGETDCSFITVGEGSTFDMRGGDRGISLEPVSRTSPDIKLRLAYDPGTPNETVQITCPDVGSSTYTSQAWRQYFDQLHVDERQDGSFVVMRQANLSETMPVWNYNNRTDTPNVTTEVTTIKLEHTPVGG